jgi:hypothetical protein
MRPEGPTSWLLNSRLGWQTASSPSVAAQERAEGEIRLDEIIFRRLRRGSGDKDSDIETDGSLGGLVLPRGMAFDEKKTLYLVDEPKSQILCFEPKPSRPGCWFVPVELQQLGQSDDPNLAGRFCKPHSIAVNGRLLYVADPDNARVQVFDLPTGKLVYVWGHKLIASLTETTAEATKPWHPIDVATWGGQAYILDNRYAQVYRHQPGRDAPCPFPLRPIGDFPRRWTRIALDKNGHLYLYDERQVRLEVFDQQGNPVSFAPPRDTSAGPKPRSGIRQNSDDSAYSGTRPPATQRPFDNIVLNASHVRHLFDPPPIRMDDKCRFCLPAELMRPCGREFPEHPPTLEDPLGLCRRNRNGQNCPGGVIFNRQGKPVRVDPADAFGNPIYVRGGHWISSRLDSQLARCRWHRVELSLTQLPPGTAVAVYTFTDEVRRNEDEIASLLIEDWDLAYRLAPPPQRDPTESEQADSNSPDFLVSSRDGRFLWLRIELTGDGYGTPAIDSIRVHYPRQSYLEDLPAVYSAEDGSRRFLERFLTVFQTEWDGLEQQVDRVHSLFDPRTVPQSAADYLAGWLGATVDPDWSLEQKRRLLTAIPQIDNARPDESSEARGNGTAAEPASHCEPISDRMFSRRGTLSGLRRYLQTYVHNLANVEPSEQDPFPIVIEGFRERRYLELSQTGAAQLGAAAPLWSRSVVGRLQLDVHARVGEVRLVSEGDPQRDYFRQFAHRFRVFLPAAWVRTRGEENLVKQALDDEKPAETQYELHLVQPGFQLGVQSTLGVDTLLGGSGETTLGCPDDPDRPQSLLPRPRLGEDTVLSTLEPPELPSFTAPPRVGITSWLVKDNKIQKEHEP